VNDTLIQFDEVQFSFGPDRPVLDGCSLQIEPGERVGLVGANGSGKTTLLHLIVGLLRPESGRIEAFGSPRRRESDFHEVRRRAGLLFQDADDQLFCPTVAEDVAFGPLNLGKTQREARAIVAQTLDSLGLAGYEERITYRLSGGEKRLVALATVLAMRPDVLLLDEPTAGLDDHYTERIAEIFVDLPQAMLIISHDRQFLDSTATRLLRLSSGRVEPA